MSASEIFVHKKKHFEVRAVRGFGGNAYVHVTRHGAPRRSNPGPRNWYMLEKSFRKLYTRPDGKPVGKIPVLQSSRFTSERVR